MINEVSSFTVSTYRALLTRRRLIFFSVVKRFKISRQVVSASCTDYGEGWSDVEVMYQDEEPSELFSGSICYYVLDFGFDLQLQISL